MSNLIPTPRTDKNGITTLRHMKPESASKKPQTALPPVALATPAREINSDQLLRTIFADQPNYEPPVQYVSAVELIRKEFPGTAEKALELVSLGNEHGDAAIQVYLTAVMDSMSPEIADGNPEGAVHNLHFDGYLGVDFDEVLVRAWAIGTVRAEHADLNTDDLQIGDFLDGMEGIRMMLYPDGSITKNISTAYWRGMTAAYHLNLDIEPEDTQQQSEVIEFVEWAGKRPDVSAVIRVAKERRTTHVETLKEILDDMSRVSPSITEGVL